MTNLFWSHPLFPRLRLDRGLDPRPAEEIELHPPSNCVTNKGEGENEVEAGAGGRDHKVKEGVVETPQRLEHSGEILLILQD